MLVILMKSGPNEEGKDNPTRLREINGRRCDEEDRTLRQRYLVRMRRINEPLSQKQRAVLWLAPSVKSTVFSSSLIPLLWAVGWLAWMMYEPMTHRQRAIPPWADTPPKPVFYPCSRQIIAHNVVIITASLNEHISLALLAFLAQMKSPQLINLIPVPIEYLQIPRVKGRGVVLSLSCGQRFQI